MVPGIESEKERRYLDLSIFVPHPGTCPVCFERNLFDLEMCLLTTECRLETQP